MDLNGPLRRGRSDSLHGCVGHGSHLSVGAPLQNTARCACSRDPGRQTVTKRPVRKPLVRICCGTPAPRACPVQRPSETSVTRSLASCRPHHAPNSTLSPCFPRSRREVPVSHALYGHVAWGSRIRGANQPNWIALRDMTRSWRRSWCSRDRRPDPARHGLPKRPCSAEPPARDRLLVRATEQ